MLTNLIEKSSIKKALGEGGFFKIIWKNNKKPCQKLLNILRKQKRS